MKELKILNQIKLTDPEKRELLARVSRKAGIPGEFALSIPTPFFNFSYLFQSSHLRVGILAVLLFAMSSATAYASLDSLPGDLLYGVKTKVVERVADLAAFTPTRRAKRNSVKIEKRIKEFEALEAKGRLTAENSARLEKDINKNFTEFDHRVKEMKEEVTKMETEHEIEAELRINLEGHADKIEKIREKENGKNQRALESVIERVKENRPKGGNDRKQPLMLK